MIRIWRELAPSCKVNIYSKITVGSQTGEEEKEEGEEGEGRGTYSYLAIDIYFARGSQFSPDPYHL